MWLLVAGDEARPLERENVDIGAGLGWAAHWPLVTAVSSHRHGEGRQAPDMGAVFDNDWNTILRGGTCISYKYLHLKLEIVFKRSC